MKKRFWEPALLAFAATLVLSACTMPDKGSGDMAKRGIVMWYGTTELTDKTVPIAKDRQIQLRAAVIPSGDALVWKTSRPDVIALLDMYGNQVETSTMGKIAVTNNLALLGEEVVITAASVVHPDVKAAVTLVVTDTR
jgi:hypothetical protein